MRKHIVDKLGVSNYCTWIGTRKALFKTVETELNERKEDVTKER